MRYLHYLFFSFNKRSLVGLKQASGRNFSGTICVHHKSGGNKNKYCSIDFYRRVNDFGQIYKIVKSPNRTGFIGGIVYKNGLFSYILLSETLLVGDIVYSGANCPEVEITKVGWSVPLSKIRLFSVISNLENYPTCGGTLARSAGSSAVLASIAGNNVSIKLKSGWNLALSKHCMATVGIVSNMKHKFNVKTKAGLSRALGIRPSVRGVAMNPCDHPHGGGEGKKSPPSGQRSPWGWLTKGTPSLKKQYQKAKKKLHKKL